MIGYGEIPPLQSNECFTAGAFDLIIFNGENRARNFSLLTLICDRYEEVKNDENFLKRYLYIWYQLSYVTDTTEKPEGIKKINESPRRKQRGILVD